MTQQDHWTDTLRREEKADEDRYFAEQDRKLSEKLHRQRQPELAAVDRRERVAELSATKESNSGA